MRTISRSPKGASLDGIIEAFDSDSRDALILLGVQERKRKEYRTDLMLRQDLGAYPETAREYTIGLVNYEDASMGAVNDVWIFATSPYALRMSLGDVRLQLHQGNGMYFSSFKDYLGEQCLVNCMSSKPFLKKLHKMTSGSGSGQIVPQFYAQVSELFGAEDLAQYKPLERALVPAEVCKLPTMAQTFAFNEKVVLDYNASLLMHWVAKTTVNRGIKNSRAVNMLDGILRGTGAVQTFIAGLNAVMCAHAHEYQDALIAGGKGLAYAAATYVASRFVLPWLDSKVPPRKQENPFASK